MSQNNTLLFHYLDEKNIPRYCTVEYSCMLDECQILFVEHDGEEWKFNWSAEQQCYVGSINSVNGEIDA